MASPAANDTDAELDSMIASITKGFDDTDDDCSTPPPSPEIGMAREGASGVEDLDLEAELGDDSDTESLKSTNTIDQHGTGNNSGDCETTPPAERQVQQSPKKSAQRARPGLACDHPAAADTTCPPVRRSARARGTLVYDQRYHPMDDVIRPFQAAKRRSLHGESAALYEGSEDEMSNESSSGQESRADDTDNEDATLQQPTRSRKRKRSESRLPEPTRRSSRRRAKPKISYNMRIHPQDSDLERAYAYDGSNSSPSPIKQVSRGGGSTKGSPGNFLQACPPLLIDEEDGTVLPQSPKTSPKSPVHEPIDADRTKEDPVKLGDVYPDLHPSVAYLAGAQASWPEIKGLPFSIYTDRIEDQLDAEAEAASPFHHQDDDKENDVVNPELVPLPNPLDGMSIIPASYYRRSPGLHPISSRSSIVSNAFYLHPQFETSPYGLGSSDSEHNAIDETRDCPIPDYMRILASGESLPRTSTPTESRPHGDDATASSSPLRNITGLDLRR